MELLDRAPSPPPSGHEPAPTTTRPTGATLQQRLEHSRAGRQLLSVVLAFTVVVVVVWNLPQSSLREAMLPVVEPAVGVLGLDQRWNLFAPNPPQRTYQVVARITYADGSLALWEPPNNDRWRKWLGVARTSQNRLLWEPTAAWIAHHHDGAERGVVRVELIRRWRDLPPPANAAIQFPWQEEIYFTYDVPAGSAR